MIEFRDIKKSFSGVEILHGISFPIEQGKVVALMGENGAGKSTLMKILSGVYTEYEGDLIKDGKVIKFQNVSDAEANGIGIIHQELNLVPDLSVAENIFLGKEPTKSGFVEFSKMYSEADKLLKEFDFPFPSKIKVRKLSVGWQQMVEIAKTLRGNAQIIIMDEPTSALTDSEIEILFQKINYLKKQGKAIIYISHRMKEITEIADQIVVMRDGSFVGKYEGKDVNREQLVELMIGKKVAEKKAEKLSLNGEEILTIEHLAVYQKGKAILNEVHFNLREGEVLGIAGLLGAGRTELLKYLYGELKGKQEGKIIYRGKEYKPTSISRAINKKIIYLSEDRKREGIFPNIGILENTTISNLKEFSTGGFIQNSAEKQEAIFKLNELNVKRHSLKQFINTLSGGNQQKALLSRLLMIGPKLLLLDEPTRGVDVGAKQEIYTVIEELRKKGMSVLVTSSEIPELMQMCTRIMVLSSGYQTALLDVDTTNAQEILSYAFKKI